MKSTTKLSLISALLLLPAAMAHADSTFVPTVSTAIYTTGSAPAHIYRTDWDDDDDECHRVNVGYLNNRLNAIIGRLNWRIDHERNEGDLDWRQTRYLHRQVWHLDREGRFALARGCVTEEQRHHFREHLREVNQQIAQLTGEDHDFDYGW